MTVVWSHDIGDAMSPRTNLHESSVALRIWVCSGLQHLYRVHSGPGRTGLDTLLFRSVDLMKAGHHLRMCGSGRNR